MAREYSFNDRDRPKWGSEDPRPLRRDDQAERLAAAELARRVANGVQRLSGTHERSANTRSFLVEPGQVQRANDGSLIIDWQGVGEGDYPSE